MGERRPYGFKKAGLKELLLPLTLLPFIAVGLGLGWATLYAWRRAHAVEAYREPMMGMQARGRVRVSGAVTRERAVTSPLGKVGVGWVGAVGYIAKDSDGDTRFEPVCVRGDLSELHLKSSLDHWTLTFVEPSDPVVLGSRSLLQDLLPIVDIGDPVAPDPPPSIPDVIKRACGAALSGSKGLLLYREAVLAADAPIEVLGCGAGQRIARCDDGGSYLLTNSTVRDLQASSRRGVDFITLFSGLWNLLIMGIVGLSVSGRLVRSTPNFQERLRSG